MTTSTTAGKSARSRKFDRFRSGRAAAMGATAAIAVAALVAIPSAHSSPTSQPSPARSVVVIDAAGQQERARAKAAEVEARVAEEAEAARIEAERLAAEKAAADQAAAEQAVREAEAAAQAEAAQAEAAPRAAEAERASEPEPQPQPQPPAVEDIAEQTMWATGSVNVRTGPGTGYARVGGLNPGDTVQVNGKANGFFRLTDGRFVSGKYLSGQQPAPAASAQDAAAAPPPASEGPRIVWKTWVANSGGNGALNACSGGLTNWTDFNIGRPYYPIHRGCGGTPILGLNIGELVQIGDTVYQVVGSKTVPRVGATTDMLTDVPGDVLVQTCYRSHADGMRVVGLSRV